MAGLLTKYDTPYKALGAGVSAGVFASLLPMLLGALNWIQPVAAGFSPLLGALVGLGASIVTWLTPKNTPPAP